MSLAPTLIAQPPVMDAHGTAAMAAEHSPINILIVDDEPKNLRVLETVLHQPGYRLVRAESADEALLALVSEDFALLILDIRMPGMSGIELAQMVKARKRSAFIPIIFLTAFYGEEANVLEGYGSGAVDYLHKPVNATVLRSKVGVFADLYRKGRELALTNASLSAEVSERRRAEQQLVEFNRTLEHRVRERTHALHASDARLRLATAAAQLGIWSWQPDLDRLVWENDWPYETLGLTREAAAVSVSGGVAPMIHPEDRDAFANVVRAAIDRAERVSFEGRLILPSLEERWIEIIGQRMPAPDTGVTSLFGTARDISARKRAEQALRDADARKDIFLATLAHELRNPLAPILAATRILSAPQAPAEAVSASRAIIARQVKHMAALLDDLLDISRVSRGKLELKRSQVDVGSALDEAIESAQPLFAAKGHHLRYTALDPSVQIVADRVRLIQVMTNLLTNAAKYTDEGGQITLSCTLQDDGLRLSVRDNGIGISPAQLPQVFEMFTQVGDSPLKADGGLGIGLALARGIVQLHGGRLEASSAGLGHGSEFVLSFPSSIVCTGSIATEATGSARPSPASRARDILIADDNRDAVTSLGYILSLAGHRVFSATCGREALDCILRDRPDAIVLDIGMPDMSGYEIARHVRQQPWGAKTTLIAVTGFGQDSDRRQALAAGFDHHLTKPIDPAALESLLVSTQG